MKKMLFIYNPRSGKSQIRTHLSAILETFSAAGFEVTVYPTKKEKDACIMAGQAGESYDVIACSGGDGTLDEVVTGMLHAGIDRPIGYIPAGSTNDFGGSLGIPRQMKKAAEVIAGGTLFACDVGQFNEDYFVYVAAFGYLTDVSYQTDQDLKNMLGHTAYLLEGLKKVGSMRSWHLKIESEEYSEEGDFVYGMISNSTSVGGIRGLTGKNVALNDGYFEVTLVRNPKDPVELARILSVLLMQEEGSECVIRFKTKKLSIFSDKPLAWTLDGENGGEHSAATLTILPEAIRMLVQEKQSTEPLDKN